MTALFVALTVLGVLLIAMYAVRRGERFLVGRVPSRLFEVDEAIEFVASALPEDVSAELSYEDVEALLGWHVLHLAGRESPVLIVDGQAIDELVERAAADGRSITRAQVRAVLDAEVEYLAAIGAVGPVAET